MVSDVMDELKAVTRQLSEYADLTSEQAARVSSLTGLWGKPEPLLKLRTGELVTHTELTRRCEQQQAQAATQTVKGQHPIMLVMDECSALDPIF